MHPQIRPPLVKRLRPSHWAALDAVAALVLAAPLLSLLRTGPTTGDLPYPLLAALAVAACLPVALRRYRPVAALGMVLAEALILVAVRPPAAVFLFALVAYVLYLVVAGRPRRAGLAAGAAALACLAVVGATGGLLAPYPAGNVLAAGFCVVAAWTAGHAVRQQRAYAAELGRRAAEQVATAERLRITRELHDVVAHSMSVIVVQAGVGHHVIDSDPAQARASLGAIETLSRETLAEIRGVLGRMRGTEPGAPSAGIPAPSLANLDRLAALTAQAGVRVDVEVRGARRELPVGIDHSAFRIIQEALTNVIKHAAASRCQVAVGYGDEELSIEVTDHGRGALPSGGSGHGIAGIRERVQIYGGRFSAGPLPGGGFRVAAHLPLRADAP